MGDKENLVEAFGDAKGMTETKRGRRVLLAVLGIGFLAAIIIVACIRAC